MLNKSFTKNPQLFEALNRDTLVKARRTGLPCFHYTEREQLGTTFGERFVNAIQEIFKKGFDHVITIGNDSPQLKTNHLSTAAVQLQQGTTVLGPTFDGGFYLMGLHRSDFDAKVFLRLPWQRFGLFNRISTLLRSNNSKVYHLPVLRDIDVEKDIDCLLNFTHSISRELQRIMTAIRSKKRLTFLEGEVHYKSLTFYSLFNKGSPLSLPLTCI